MAMASRAPMNSYKRRYFVASHAVDRLRDRWAKMDSHRHRNDPDLGNLIDSSVASAVAHKRVEALVDDEGPFKAVAFGQELDDNLVAVVRPNSTTSKGAPAEAIVTVLGGGMAEQKRANGTWRKAGAPANAMEAALQKAGVTRAFVVETHAAEVNPEVRELIEEVAPKVLKPARMLVTFTSSVQGEVMDYVEADRVRDRLRQLLSDRLVSDVRVWREVPFKPRVEIDFPLEE